MEEDREVAEMVFLQQVAHARVAVGVKAAVFRDALRPQSDHGADPADIAVMRLVV